MAMPAATRQLVTWEAFSGVERRATCKTASQAASCSIHHWVDRCGRSCYLLWLDPGSSMQGRISRTLESGWQNRCFWAGVGSTMPSSTSGRDLWVRMAVGARLSLAIGLAVIPGWNDRRRAWFAGGSLWQADRQRYRVRGRCADCGTGSGAGYRRQRALFARRRGRHRRADVFRMGVVPAGSPGADEGFLGSAFVEASRSIRGNRWWIARKHLLPNAIGPVIVIATQQVAAVMFFESALSYLGLGVLQYCHPGRNGLLRRGSDAGRLVGACLAGGSDHADRAEFEPDWRRVAATDRSKAASVVYSERKEN